MNILPAFPTNLSFTTTNFNTESARRENQLRETIPALTQPDDSAAEKGVFTDNDRLRQPATQTTQNPTYDKPSANQQPSSAEQSIDQDNADDPSAGKQNAEDKQKQQAEEGKIEELKQRDVEVRNHEQAHARAGGQHASAPNYEFESGPDGKRYAVEGEVSIDISEESSPEETLRKMQQVQSAALAPVEPSPKDLQVAAEANQKASEARAEIAQQRSKETSSSFDQVFGEGDNKTQQGPELEDIVQGAGVDSVRRSLQEDDPVAQASGNEVSLESANNSHTERYKNLINQRDAGINQRALRITDHYLQTSQVAEHQIELSA
ncbi:putative metalloprotease CJM1_0395 family protein [Neptunicella marina]|uniref:Catalase n=1 Tax=Neptunicella marina TaxID=2125989 RepID=A0A8J6ITA5_9ALTE|nr:putative metalloprotease CJM1_0395 family protein [Neptunicella marina]MBC3765934.1 hypothetical protein [Neptunicella marina]